MSEKNILEELIDHAEAYASTKVRITKLQAVEKGSQLSGSLVATIFFILILISVFGLLSISGAFALSQWLGSHALGFLAMGGIYSVVGLLFFLNREKWIHRPVANAVIKTILTDTNHDS
jgi:hypothetical protein